MSNRVSNELRCSNSAGELAKFENREPFVGVGYRFNSLIALGSSRPAGMIFRPQAASVKLVVDGAHVPNGSRTNPVAVAGKPETGSTTPAVTARVVAGSSTVPTGINRP